MDTDSIKLERATIKFFESQLKKLNNFQGIRGEEWSNNNETLLKILNKLKGELVDYHIDKDVFSLLKLVLIIGLNNFNKNEPILLAFEILENLRPENLKDLFEFISDNYEQKKIKNSEIIIEKLLTQGDITCQIAMVKMMVVLYEGYASSQTYQNPIGLLWFKDDISRKLFKKITFYHKSFREADSLYSFKFSSPKSTLSCNAKWSHIIMEICAEGVFSFQVISLKLGDLILSSFGEERYCIWLDYNQKHHHLRIECVTPEFYEQKSVFYFTNDTITNMIFEEDMESLFLLLTSKYNIRDILGGIPEQNSLEIYLEIPKNCNLQKVLKFMTEAVMPSAEPSRQVSREGPSETVTENTQKSGEELLLSQLFSIIRSTSCSPRTESLELDIAEHEDHEEQNMAENKQTQRRTAVMSTSDTENDDTKRSRNSRTSERSSTKRRPRTKTSETIKNLTIDSSDQEKPKTAQNIQTQQKSAVMIISDPVNDDMERSQNARKSERSSTKRRPRTKTSETIKHLTVDSSDQEKPKTPQNLQTQRKTAVISTSGTENSYTERSPNSRTSQRSSTSRKPRTKTSETIKNLTVDTSDHECQGKLKTAENTGRTKPISYSDSGNLELSGQQETKSLGPVDTENVNHGEIPSKTQKHIGRKNVNNSDSTNDDSKRSRPSRRFDRSSRSRRTKSSEATRDIIVDTSELESQEEPKIVRSNSRQRIIAGSNDSSRITKTSELVSEKTVDTSPYESRERHPEQFNKSKKTRSRPEKELTSQPFGRVRVYELESSGSREEETSRNSKMINASGSQRRKGRKSSEAIAKVRAKSFRKSSESVPSENSSIEYLREEVRQTNDLRQKTNSGNEQSKLDKKRTEEIQTSFIGHPNGESAHFNEENQQNINQNFKVNPINVEVGDVTTCIEKRDKISQLSFPTSPPTVDDNREDNMDSAPILSQTDPQSYNFEDRDNFSNIIEPKTIESTLSPVIDTQSSTNEDRENRGRITEPKTIDYSPIPPEIDTQLSTIENANDYDAVIEKGAIDYSPISPVIDSLSSTYEDRENRGGITEQKTIVYSPTSAEIDITSSTVEDRENCAKIIEPKTIDNSPISTIIDTESILCENRDENIEQSKTDLAPNSSLNDIQSSTIDNLEKQKENLGPGKRSRRLAEKNRTIPRLFSSSESDVENDRELASKMSVTKDKEIQKPKAKLFFDSISSLSDSLFPQSPVNIRNLLEDISIPENIFDEFGVTDTVARPSPKVTILEPVVANPPETSTVLRPAESPTVMRRAKNHINTMLLESPVVKRPDKSPVVKRPDKSPVVKRPAESPVVKRPAESPVVKRPAKSPVVKRPAKSPVVKRPAKSPVVKRPAKSPVVKRPAKSPVVKRPDKSPVVKRPAESPIYSVAAENPIVTRAAESPVVTRAAESPVVTRAAESPVVTRAAESPVVTRAAESPVVTRAAESPVVTRAAENPIFTRAAESPIFTRAAESPIVTRAAESPIVTRAAESPIVTRAAESPIVTRAAESPIITRAAENPVVTKPIEKTTVTKSIKKPIDTLVTKPSEKPNTTKPCQKKTISKEKFKTSTPIQKDIPAMRTIFTSDEENDFILEKPPKPSSFKKGQSKPPKYSKVMNHSILQSPKKRTNESTENSTQRRFFKTPRPNLISSGIFSNKKRKSEQKTKKGPKKTKKEAKKLVKVEWEEEDSDGPFSLSKLEIDSIKESTKSSKYTGWRPRISPRPLTNWIEIENHKLKIVGVSVNSTRFKSEWSSSSEWDPQQTPRKKTVKRLKRKAKPNQLITPGNDSDSDHFEAKKPRTKKIESTLAAPLLSDDSFEEEIRSPDGWRNEKLESEPEPKSQSSPEVINLTDHELDQFSATSTVKKSTLKRKFDEIVYEPQKREIREDNSFKDLSKPTNRQEGVNVNKGSIFNEKATIFESGTSHKIHKSRTKHDVHESGIGHEFHESRIEQEIHESAMDQSELNNRDVTVARTKQPLTLESVTFQLASKTLRPNFRFSVKRMVLKFNNNEIVDGTVVCNGVANYVMEIDPKSISGFDEASHNTSNTDPQEIEGVTKFTMTFDGNRNYEMNSSITQPKHVETSRTNTPELEENHFLEVTPEESVPPQKMIDVSKTTSEKADVSKNTSENFDVASDRDVSSGLSKKIPEKSIFLKKLPKTSEDQKLAPKTSDVSKLASKTSDHPKLAPKKSDDPMKAPKTSEDPKLAPKTSDHPKLAPKKSDDLMKGPKTSNDPKKAAKKSDDPKKAANKSDDPKKATKKSDDPKKAENKSDGPKKALKKSDDPKKAKNKSDFPKEDPKKTLEESDVPKKTIEKSENPKKSGNPKKDQEKDNDLKNRQEKSRVIKKTPEKSRVIKKTPEKSNNVKKTPEKSDNVQKMQKKSDNVQKMQEKSDNVQKMQKKSDNVQKMQEKSDNVKKTPEKSDNVKKTPEKSDNVKKTPEKSDNVKMQEKSDNAKNKTKKSDNVKKTQEKSDNAKRTPEKSDNSKKMTEKSDNVKKMTEKSDHVKKTQEKSDNAKKTQGKSDNAKKTPEKSDNVIKTTEKTVASKKTASSGLSNFPEETVSDIFNVTKKKTEKFCVSDDSKKMPEKSGDLKKIREKSDDPKKTRILQKTPDKCDNLKRVQGEKNTQENSIVPDKTSDKSSIRYKKTREKSEVPKKVQEKANDPKKTKEKCDVVKESQENSKIIPKKSSLNTLTATSSAVDMSICTSEARSSVEVFSINAQHGSNDTFTSYDSEYEKLIEERDQSIRSMISQLTKTRIKFLIELDDLRSLALNEKDPKIKKLREERCDDLKLAFEGLNKNWKRVFEDFKTERESQFNDDLAKLQLKYSRFH